MSNPQDNGRPDEPAPPEQEGTPSQKGGSRSGGDFRRQFLPIRRKRLLLHMALIVGLMGIVMSWVLPYQTESIEVAKTMTWVFYLAFAVAFTSLMWAIFIWKCPNCHRHIPPEFKERCPNCGVLLK